MQQQILLAEADKLGIHATSDDVRQYLQTGPAGQVLFPNGKFIGTAAVCRHHREPLRHFGGGV